MDEPLPRSVTSRYGLCLALVTITLLPGCAWVRGKQTAQPSPPAASPVRSEPATAVAGTKKSSAPVGLDGSAAQPADELPNGTGLVATAGGSADSDITADDLRMPHPDEIADSEPQSALQEPRIARASLNAESVAATDGVGGVKTADVADADVETSASRKQDPASDLPESFEVLGNLPGNFDVIGDGVKVEQGLVAATVNGIPIFVEDVLRDVPAEFLEQTEKRMEPKQFKEWRKGLINSQLQRHIEEQLLLQALKTKLKPDAMKDVHKQIDTMFNKEYLPKAMKQAGFETEGEFEQALRQKGSSIELLRTKNRNRQLAEQYIGHKLMPKSGFDRPDLLRYYNDHKSDYAIPAQAKWEQIHLKYSKHGGREAAQDKAAEIRNRLATGAKFSDVARELSNGPNASKGGGRGWTTQGALADEALNAALFDLPLNEVSEPIVGANGVDIIRVVDRTEASYKPFAAVQEDIRAQLKSEEWSKASRKLFDELMEHATIVKLTDKL